MLLTDLPEDERRAVFAGAFLLYAREQADWSPPPYAEDTVCRCAQCQPREPQRGTAAWFDAMRRRHRATKRARR